MGDLVVLEAVPTEMEAELICSLLRTEGIRCMYRPTNFAAGSTEGLPAAGPHEVLVRGEDAGDARRLLEAQRRTS